jgi:membrane fusion protein (multidrug efflux system)
MKNKIIFICIAALWVAACKHNENQKHEESIFIVTNPVSKDTVVLQKFVCQIRSHQHIDLRALEKGYLQNIYVDEGQTVRKGQILFQLMPLTYQAEMNKAQAELNFVEIEYRNTKALADSNIVSSNELALAKAKLEKARAELELAKARLSFTEIRAPFDGIIGKFKDVRIGSLVEEGELFTTLSDNSKMWVYFNVPEAEYINYATHNQTNRQPVRVKLQMANNELFDQEGIIETIEADFNNETGNIAFRAAFQNPQRILRHGETGNVLMPITLKNKLLIPQKATFEVLDKKYVFVVGEGNLVTSKEIVVQHEMPHIYALSSGLKPTDKILLEGIRKVKNGDKIKYKVKSFYSVLNELDSLKAE